MTLMLLAESERSPATATTGGAFGVYGVSNSPNGTAVQGYAASSSAGASAGVAGFTNNGGNGVVGGASATTGLNFGVQGIGFSSGGVGMQGSSPHVAVVGINQVCSPTCNLVVGTAGQFITGSGGLSSKGLRGAVSLRCSAWTVTETSPLLGT